MPTRERTQKEKAGEPDFTTERYEGDSQERLFDMVMGLLATNAKRTFDTYQDLDLQAARRSQDTYDKVQSVNLQALQNAVTFTGYSLANTLTHQVDTNAQKVRHADVAKVLNQD